MTNEGQWKVVEGRDDPPAGGQSPPQETAGVRAFGYPAMTVSFWPPALWGHYGRLTAEDTWLWQLGWEVQGGRVQYGLHGCKRKVMHHAQVTVFVAWSSIGLRRKMNQDEQSEPAALRMWWKNQFPVSVTQRLCLKKVTFYQITVLRNSELNLSKQGSWISQPMMFLNGICC